MGVRERHSRERMPGTLKCLEAWEKVSRCSKPLWKGGKRGTGGTMQEARSGQSSKHEAQHNGPS